MNKSKDEYANAADLKPMEGLLSPADKRVNRSNAWMSLASYRWSPARTVRSHDGAKQYR
jgi:hypothetical protein